VSELPKVTLTADEAEGLHDLLAWVALVEERGFNNDRHMIEMTAETWQDATRSAKQKLSRLARYRLVPDGMKEPQ
jgi:hypothetical protein